VAGIVNVGPGLDRKERGHCQVDPIDVMDTRFRPLGGSLGAERPGCQDDDEQTDEYLRGGQGEARRRRRRRRLDPDNALAEERDGQNAVLNALENEATFGAAGLQRNRNVAHASPDGTTGIRRPGREGNPIRSGGRRDARLTIRSGAHHASEGLMPTRPQVICARH